MGKWTSKSRAINVGDTVAYSKTFLQSTGQYTGNVPHARGKVLALHQLSPETTLAEIEWEKPDLPSRVNVKNLSTKQQIQMGE
jgi:hypothetical protein